MHDIEGLGVFYLGRKLDVAGSAVTSEPLLYDARDLTTHGLIVGMTGSGKTGLALGLLEEAALDGVPAIAIDPKGDLGNLLLSFPGLSAQDFAPWVDAGEAQRDGLAPEAYAAKLAATWRKGLADSGQAPERIARLRAAAEFTLYTPGSSAGRPLSILRTLAAPSADVRADTELLRERVGAAVGGLLALLGIEVDPLQSPEHILLARLVEHAWCAGRDLDLAALIRAIQKPPFERIGVLDLESFYPARERAGLALRLNNLLASSNFSAWLEGEPLDVQNLLWTPQGKPRISIVSIAHLSESERMFVVTLVLGELIAWMRRQPGTASLRALLYMDEVYGYFPPVANPPAKGPMLTLLKQARAYGLGVVLATQNPVDLDYKGLSNCGTWFLGRLQTERDKARVLDGLEGASAASGRAFDRARVDAILSGLAKRVFLMNNVHDETPTLFQTRWTMSYLRGPLTRAQIKQLQPANALAPIPASPAGAPSAAGATNAPAAAVPVAASSITTSSVATGPVVKGTSTTRASSTVPSSIEGATPKAAQAMSFFAGPSSATSKASPTSATQACASSQRPLAPHGIEDVFLGAPAARTGALTYAPRLLGAVRVHYVDAKLGLDVWEKVAVLAPIDLAGSANPWEQARELEIAKVALSPEPAAGALYLELPTLAQRDKTWPLWSKALQSWLYSSRPLSLYRCAELKLASKPGESESAFRSRVAQALREERDLELSKLQQKYAPKVAALQERLRRSEQKLEREQEQYGAKKLDAGLSIGASILGALFGNKLASRSNVASAASATRSVGRASKEKSDIEKAQQDRGAAQQQLAELDAEFKERLAMLQAEFDATRATVDCAAIAPRKADTLIESLCLCWEPL
jgi:hypothetical protein